MAGERKIWDVNMGPTQPLGHGKQTVSTSAVALPSQPSSAKRVVIRTLGQPINWRDDGTDPTGTVGMTLLADETLVYDGPIASFKMIRTSAATGDADVRVAYYGQDT